MSVLFDSVWQWREQFSFPYDGGTSRLDSASNNPTLPDPPKEPTPSESNLDFNAFTHTDLMSPSLGGFPDPNFDVFDPLIGLLENPLMNYSNNGVTANNMAYMDNASFYG